MLALVRLPVALQLDVVVGVAALDGGRRLQVLLEVGVPLILGLVRRLRLGVAGLVLLGGVLDAAGATSRVAAGVLMASAAAGAAAELLDGRALLGVLRSYAGGVLALDGGFFFEGFALQRLFVFGRRRLFCLLRLLWFFFEVLLPTIFQTTNVLTRK